MNWVGERVLILGLGASGQAAAGWLARQGAQVRVADQGEAPSGLDGLRANWPEVPVRLGPWAEEDFSWAQRIVISPGVPQSDPVVQAAAERGVPVWSDVEVFARALPAQARVIAITGSNGKSTVTSMVAAMCKAAGWKTRLAGNIGIPVLQALEEAPDTQIFVLELSSFQLENIYSLHSDAAVVLNLSEDHLDRYADMAAYVAAKARIYADTGMQVVNRDDAAVVRLARADRPLVLFGLDRPQRHADFGLIDGQLCRGETSLLAVRELRVTGTHNVANALAAWALCHALGMADEPLARALREFRGLPHRVEWVSSIAGADYYDDSKGTNVGATEAAVVGMDRPVVLIAGGEGKGQDFAPLARVAVGRVRALVQIGRDGQRIADVFAAVGIETHRAESMDAAVGLAHALAQPGDAVLLSPACASFDMFDNYAHRARVFVTAVQHLAGEQP